MFEFRENKPDIVVGLLIKSRLTGRVLLIQRNDQNRFWSLLSGGQDDSDIDDMYTIKREIGEELMIKDTDYIDIVKVRDEIVLGGRRIFKYYQGFVDKEFTVVLDEENISWGWFDPNGISKVNGQFNILGLPKRLYPGLLDKINNI